MIGSRGTHLVIAVEGLRTGESTRRGVCRVCYRTVSQSEMKIVGDSADRNRGELFPQTFTEWTYNNYVCNRLVGKEARSAMTSKPSTPISPAVVVISGGTAANSLVSAFQGLAGSSQLTYVLPIRYLSVTNS
jgi:hypothetical protein